VPTVLSAMAFWPKKSSPRCCSPSPTSSSSGR
jgi:hypothetical protein